MKRTFIFDEKDMYPIRINTQNFQIKVQYEIWCDAQSVEITEQAVQINEIHSTEEENLEVQSAITGNFSEYTAESGTSEYDKVHLDGVPKMLKLRQTGAQYPKSESSRKVVLQIIFSK